MEYDPKTGVFETAVVSRSTKDVGGFATGRQLTNRRRRIERMIREKFASVNQVEDMLNRLQAKAYAEDAKPEFFRMLMDRVIGPVRTDEQLDAGVEKRLAEMLGMAEREARRRSDAIDVKPEETTKHGQKDETNDRG